MNEGNLSAGAVVGIIIAIVILVLLATDIGFFVKKNKGTVE